ncbi:hypothetical protein BDV98DRAFT_223843 [Pterulicium gracile]|uniref:F-box domain-containing protein n=1 Tax=Pterulicium gracile TaxID=1884261 RepID=A0A5C3QYE8_9AGAR|nr:hypothetical protein BDV98DRAFT_223843 [Pterula gracilis]
MEGSKSAVIRLERKTTLTRALSTSFAIGLQIRGTQRNITLPKPDLFMQAPKLKTLYLTNANLNVLNFPWLRLTTLSLSHVRAEMDRIKQMFAQCTSLLDLHLDSMHFQSEAVFSGPSIAISALKTLEYEVSQEDGGLLGFLHMPALEELTLINGAPFEEIAAYFLSSHPPLKSLRFSPTFWLADLADPDGVADALADSLAPVPTLERLSMEFPGAASPLDMEELNLILMLLGFRKEEKLCPSPHTLGLHNAAFTPHTGC